MVDALMQHLHISAALLGTISAFFYYTYTALQIPAGLLCDRYGPRIVLTLAVLSCAIGAYVFGFSDFISLTSLGRLLMGAGSAFAFVVTLTLILNWFPPHYFAVLAGVTQLLGSAGAIAGEAPLSAVMGHLGWHPTLNLLGSCGLVLAALVYLIVRDHPQEERAYQLKKTHVSMRKSLLTVLLSRQTWPIAFFACLIWAPITTFGGLWGLPFIAQTHHLTTFAAGEVIASIWIGVGIGSPLIGWMSERIKQRKAPLVCCSLLGLISCLILLYVPQLSTPLLLIVLFMMGLSASGQSLSFALIADITPRSSSSAAIGFNNMAIVCGAIFLQPLVGQLLDLHWHGVMVHGVRSYGTEAFQSALSILPLCYIGALVASLFWIKESHCQPPHHK
jgi:MFS family permease